MPLRGSIAAASCSIRPIALIGTGSTARLAPFGTSKT